MRNQVKAVMIAVAIAAATAASVQALDVGTAQGIPEAPNPTQCFKAPCPTGSTVMRSTRPAPTTSPTSIILVRQH